MKVSRDAVLTVVLLVVVIALMVAAGLQQNKERLPVLYSKSSGPTGALALSLWMDELGYQVKDVTLSQFQIPRDVSILFVLQPDPAIALTEMETIDAWVQDGGTLIAAGDNFGTVFISRYYEFDTRYFGTSGGESVQQAPFLSSPPLDTAIDLNSQMGFISDREDFVTILERNGLPVVVTFNVGEGTVVLCSGWYPFSNSGLKADGNPELILNLLALADKEGVIWFDEWHHGVRGKDEIVGVGSWLRFTPAGRSLLFMVGAIFLALIAQGRNFGRALPLAREIFRRGPIEHLSAVANLSRRGGHRKAVLGYYHQQVKRCLGRRYRLDPALPDDEFVHLLSGYNAELDSNALLELLKKLSQPDPTENEMLKLSVEASLWLEK